MTANIALLRQIQDAAVSSAVPVSESLRRCKVLAVRASVPALAAWVDHELNGYPEGVELPDYRIAYGEAKGHFLGAFGSSFSNALIPPACLPEKHQDWAHKAYLRQPLAALEDFTRAGEDSNPQVPWPGNLVVLMQHKVYARMVLSQAWLEISRSVFVGAVETVRNRTLSFALELEKLMGSQVAGEDTAVPGQRVAQVFNTHIYGAVTNLAQASAGAQLNAGLAAVDVASLIASVKDLGVPDKEADELQEAMRADGEEPRKELGPRVASWLGTVISQAAAGTLKVAVSTATTTLPKILSRHYGIDI